MILFYFIGLVLCEEKRYESYDIIHAKTEHFLRKLWGEERLTEDLFNDYN